MGRLEIQDEFTNLPVSKQRKWQLRHPEKARELKRRFEKSPMGRAQQRRYRERRRERMRGK